MTKMETMNTKFAALTEEELMDVDGGGAIIAFVVAHPYVSGAIVGAVTAVGTAIVGAFRKR